MEKICKTRDLAHDRGKMETLLRAQTPSQREEVIEERLQLLINNWPQKDLRQKIGLKNKGGFQPQTGHSEQWTVDPSWDMDRPAPVQQHESDRPGPSSAPIPMEQGKTDSETDQDQVKSVQYVKMGHAPRFAVEERNDWNLEQAVRETKKDFLRTYSCL